MTIQETEISAPTDTTPPPASPPTETPQPSQETPAEPTESGADEGGETPADDPEDWESFKARHFDADESPYKAHYEQLISDQRDEQFQRALDWVKPQIEGLKEVNAIAEEQKTLQTKANEAFRLLTSRIDKAANEMGLDPEGLSQILSSNSAAWEALQSIGQNAQKDQFNRGYSQGQSEQAFADLQAAIENGSKLAKKPSLISQLAPELSAARKGEKQMSEVWNSWLTKAFQARYEAGLEDGRKGTAEGQKVTDRKGQVPPQNVGSNANAGLEQKIQDGSASMAEIIEAEKAGLLKYD